MTEATRTQIENMKNQTYGVEVEMNNMKGTWKRIRK